jgi:hypothetical protein
MSFLNLVVLFLCIGFFVYKRSYKIVIIYIVLFFGFIGYFLCRLDIEDYYGRNNHVFFEGKYHDTILILDRETNKIIAKGQIEIKSWNRVFIGSEKDTLDLNDWIERKAGYMANIICEIEK